MVGWTFKQSIKKIFLLVETCIKEISGKYVVLQSNSVSNPKILFLNISFDK